MMRGKTLEKRVNNVNIKSRRNEQSMILQIPTPIILTNSGLVAKESTVDFAGVLPGGRFIAFDTKETKSKTSFPLSNIKQHQLIYLNAVEKLGGIAFFFVQFVSLHPDQAFIIVPSLVNKYLEDNSRKSIPLKELSAELLISIDNYLDKVTTL